MFKPSSWQKKSCAGEALVYLGRGAGAASGQGRDIFGQMLGACVPAAARKRRAICLGDTSKNCVRGLLTLLSPRLSLSPYPQGSGRCRNILVHNQEESKQEGIGWKLKYLHNRSGLSQQQYKQPETESRNCKLDEDRIQPGKQRLFSKEEIIHQLTFLLAEEGRVLESQTMLI